MNEEHNQSILKEQFKKKFVLHICSTHFTLRTINLKGIPQDGAHSRTINLKGIPQDGAHFRTASGATVTKWFTLPNAVSSRCWIKMARGLKDAASVDVLLWESVFVELRFLASETEMPDFCSLATAKLLTREANRTSKHSIKFHSNQVKRKFDYSFFFKSLCGPELKSSKHGKSDKGYLLHDLSCLRTCQGNTTLILIASLWYKFHFEMHTKVTNTGKKVKMFKVNNKGYHHTKSERSRWNNVQENASINVRASCPCMWQSRKIWTWSGEKLQWKYNLQFDPFQGRSDRSHLCLQSKKENQQQQQQQKQQQKISSHLTVWKFLLQTANQLDRDCHHSTVPQAIWQYPNTKRFKRRLIYFNTDTKYSYFRGNPLYQATKRHVNNT